jgi:polar amino acid transport system substrate-binding protein
MEAVMRGFWLKWSVSLSGAVAGWVMAAAVGPASAAEVPVQWVSEAFPPFSFVGPGGPRGIAVDLMGAALAKAGLPDVAPAFMPWARVLQVLEEPTPVCVTAMTRTAAREARYQWVGPFVPADIAVGRRTPAPPWPRSDQPLAGLSVVVVRGDVSEEAARTLGTQEKRLFRVPDPESAARMMLAGRVDAWVYGEAVMRWTLNSLQTPPAQYRIDGKVHAGDNYFACSRAVSAGYLKRLQQGLDALKQAPKGGLSDYDKIVARYLNAGPPR